MSRNIYLAFTFLFIGCCVLYFKLNTANNSFEKYIEESKKLSNTYECLKINCLNNKYLETKEINFKKVVIVIPEKTCFDCIETFDLELKPKLESIKGIEVMTQYEKDFKDILIENHIRFEHVTVLALDRYKIHYVYEYHPVFPFKKAKTQALLSFLDEFSD